MLIGYFSFKDFYSSCRLCVEGEYGSQDYNLKLKTMSHVLDDALQSCYYLNYTVREEELRYKSLFKVGQKLSVCNRYELEQMKTKPTYVSPWLDLNIIESGSVTLVTQMTSDKLGVFEKVLEEWTGPVSVTYYLECNDTRDAAVISRLRTWANRTNLDIHFVLKTGVSIYTRKCVCLVLHV